MVAADCTSSADRITAARTLQDDPESKFGDIQLFEALAADEAICVWKPEGSPSVKPLQDFVFASEAAAKRQRFKVPCYRHPDALRHPVFTDFGNSRWGIDFSANRAPAKLGELSQKVEKIRGALSKAQDKCGRVTLANQKQVEEQAAELRAKLQEAQFRLDAMSDLHRVEMRLLTGSAIETVPLRWACKRLTTNLSLDHRQGSVEPQVERKPVVRADRLGRAARNVGSGEAVAISGLFDQDHWNGRLQAPARSSTRSRAGSKNVGGMKKRAQCFSVFAGSVSFSRGIGPAGAVVRIRGAERTEAKPEVLAAFRRE